VSKGLEHNYEEDYAGWQKRLLEKISKLGTTGGYYEVHVKVEGRRVSFKTYETYPLNTDTSCLPPPPPPATM